MLNSTQYRQNSNKSLEILLLENNFDKISIFQEFVNQKEIRNNLCLFRNGIEVIDYLKNESRISDKPCPFLILMNMELPYSLEVLMEINNNLNFSNIPVVIFSRQNKDEIISKFNLNSNFSILKPKDLEKSFEIIKKVETSLISEVYQNILCNPTKKRSYLL